MLFHGIKLVEGSEIQNLVVDTGATFPATPDNGEFFYINTSGTYAIGLYLYEGATAQWVRMVQQGDSISGLLPDVVTPGTYKSITVNSTGIVTGGSNPTTLSGYGITDAQPLDADLTAIGALVGTSGFLKKTAADTWSLDTNTYLTGNQTITLTGDVTGSGTTSITATLGTTGVAAGAYGSASNVPYITVDSKGRVTALSNTPIALDSSAIISGTLASARISQASVTQYQSALSIAESQITNDSLLARVADNETITGSWTFSVPVSGQTPTASTHLTTKAYVDGLASGVLVKQSVIAATTGPITLAGNQTIDGVGVVSPNRVLVKDQADSTQNGIYVADSGTWTRATDFDGSPSVEVAVGDTVFVELGTSNANTSWIVTGTGNITVGSSPIVWTLFSRAGGLTVNGGLTHTGNTIAVATASSSRIVINSNSIDLATTGVTAGTFAQVIVDSYGRVTGGNANLSFSYVSNTPTTLAGYGITDAQGLNSNLTAVSNLSTTGFISRTGSGTVSTRTLGVSGVGLSISNADGVSGNPSIASNATDTNTASTIVARDASGNFSAGTITATLAGNASTATKATNIAGGAAGSIVYQSATDTTTTLSIGTSGYILTSTGSGLQWSAPSASSVGSATNATNIGITAVTSNATVYPTFVTATSGNLPAEVASTLTFNPSTGLLTATGFSGSGASLTSIPNSALNNSSVTVTAGTGLSGGGAVALGGSVTLTNAGVTSITSNTGLSANVAATGAVTITNTGVTSLVAGTNISLSGSTGAVTVGITGTVAAATTATNLAGGAAGSIPYQTGSGATSMLATGSGVLVGGTTPSWSTAPTLTGTNFTGIPNGALSNSSVTVTAGTGMSGGGSVSLGGSITLTNAGVTSLAGTTNQVSVSGSTGAVTISLPQNINSGAAPTFAGTNFTSIPNSALTNSSITVNGTAISLGGSGTVTAAAGTLTGSTLNSTVTASSLTSVGTLSTLTVNSGGSANSATATVFVYQNGQTVSIVPSNTAGSFNPAVQAGDTTIVASAAAIGNGVLTLVPWSSTNVGIRIAGSGTITMTGTTNTSILNATNSGAGQALTATSTGSTNTVIVTDTGTNGANVKLVGNGATTPNKTIRAVNGLLQFVNSAYSAVPWQMDDSGNITQTGTITINTSSLQSVQVSGNIASMIGMTITNSNATGTSGLLLTANGVNKYIRQNGANNTLEYVNSAASAVIASLTDSGVFNAQYLTATNSVTGNTTVIAGPSGSGQMIMNSGDATHTGYLAFFAANANRQGYIGYSASTGTGDSGTISYVAGTHSFNGNLAMATGYISKSNASGIAAAGSSQGTATALSKELNVVSSGTGGVLLPNSLGTTFIIWNTTGAAINVYPASGLAIDSLAANAAFSLPNGGKIMFVQFTSGSYGTLNATYA